MEKPKLFTSTYSFYLKFSFFFLFILVFSIDLLLSSFHKFFFVLLVFLEPNIIHNSFYSTWAFLKKKFILSVANIHVYEFSKLSWCNWIFCFVIFLKYKTTLILIFSCLYLNFCDYLLPKSYDFCCFVCFMVMCIRKTTKNKTFINLKKKNV
jgi:hypothetical protein